MLKKKLQANTLTENNCKGEIFFFEKQKAFTPLSSHQLTDYFKAQSNYESIVIIHQTKKAAFPKMHKQNFCGTALFFFLTS